MASYDPGEAGLDTLLDLDGHTIEVGGGFWVSMSTSRVPKDAGRPSGIRYALSLHTPGGKRVLGYDNAHAAHASTGPGDRSLRPIAFDHRHKGARVIPYEFRSPGELLEDFWRDVATVLKEAGVS